MRNIGLVLGILVFFLTLLLPAPEGMSGTAWLTAGVGLLMACWWATEAVPVPVTSLLPIILFPLLGQASVKEITAPYAHPVIYLLFGGFIIATALERWNLHRRLALNVLTRVGNHPSAIVGGFMAATAFLSMWISNTATTIMMIPIALSIAHVITNSNEKGNSFTICLVLGIAYAASIGGLGTIIGTPPNAMLAAFMSENYGVEIGFVQWMTFGVPAVLLLVPVAWFVLTKIAFNFKFEASQEANDLVVNELNAMGKISRPEKRTALAFLFIALAWITRPLIQKHLGFSALNDTIIAITGAVMMFLIPAGDDKDKNARLLNWQTAERIPWGVLVLFGGGLSLASMVSKSGLAAWIGDGLASLTVFHLLILITSIVTMVIFLTELTSNTATTAALLPILGTIAVNAGFDPILLTAPMALAASCAFMLPVATAPNAIVYATDEVSIVQMAKAGVYLNIAAIVVISLLSYALVSQIFLGA